MTVNYNVPGKKRKELAQVIAKWTGHELKYLGAPSFAYQIECFTIDKEGTLSFDNGLGGEFIQRLLEHLHNEGFELEDISCETPNDSYSPEDVEEMLIEQRLEEQDEMGIVIQMPKAEFDDRAVQNLRDLVESKADLIKKALGTENLTIHTYGETLDFPWFKETTNPEEVKTYIHFVTALCEMAKKLTRVNKSEKEIENEKYAFRCFLLRLGFIGAEYKTERKILLKNFTGSAAFKNTQKKEEE